MHPFCGHERVLALFALVRVCRRGPALGEPGSHDFPSPCVAALAALGGGDASVCACA